MMKPLILKWIVAAPVFLFFCIQQLKLICGSKLQQNFDLISDKKNSRFHFLHGLKQFLPHTTLT